MRAPLLVALALASVPFATLAPAAASTTLVVGPGGFTTIQAAVNAAQPGDTVLVKPGVYPEAVLVATPGITLRGEDRETVILEGARQRDHGVAVVADGVSIESMTAQNYNSNGFFFSDVDGFRMHNLHAKDNTVYGLYAIRSTNGDIGYSFAEGHGDGGLYIGETGRCECHVHHNVAWNNMLGYSGTANSYVFIHDNEFHDNRAGILMSVLPNEMGLDEDNELRGTQVHTQIYNNHVHHNNNRDAPVAPGSLWETVHVPVGEGITIAGGWMNDVHHNTIVANDLWGVGIFWLFTPPRANVVHENAIADSRYGIWWDEWGEDHCFAENLIDADTVEVVSDPDPLPACESVIGPLPCPPEATDLAACRAGDVRAPSALKDGQLAFRALTDQPANEG